jgi:hypothetical protein
MSIPQQVSDSTSNDLLERLIAVHALPRLDYRNVAQGAEDPQDIENGPAVSMEPYLSTPDGGA